jgi:hypothetical protein
MSEAIYQATYRDQNGHDAIVVRNDGTTLTTHIRGVVFSGVDFDCLAPADATTSAALATFSLHCGALCNCVIAVEIPVPIAKPDEVVEGLLRAELTLGELAANGGLDLELLRLTLLGGGREWVSSGTTGYFEDELLDLQRQLPSDAYLLACFNCQYSDYSPYGNGLFGSMLCFRNIKEEYLRVRSKQEFLSVHGRAERFVQETYLCKEFARRAAGTGYRG